MSAETQAPAAAGGGQLRIWVILLAAIACWSAVSALAVFFHLDEYGNSLSQRLLFAGYAIKPFLAVPALVFAIRGDVRRAIMALAAIIIVDFLTDTVPSIITEGLKFGSGVTGLHLFAVMIVFPMLAVVAFVLARRNDRLWLATVFVALPPIATVLGVLAFAIGVAIYGF